MNWHYKLQQHIGGSYSSVRKGSQPDLGYMQIKGSKYSYDILFNSINYCSYEVDFRNDEGKLTIKYRVINLIIYLNFIL